MSDQSESPEQIPLSAEDMAAIRAACAAPPEPGSALLRAAERYKERVRSVPDKASAFGRQERPEPPCVAHGALRT